MLLKAVIKRHYQSFDTQWSIEVAVQRWIHKSWLLITFKAQVTSHVEPQLNKWNRKTSKKTNENSVKIYLYFYHIVGLYGYGKCLSNYSWIFFCN